MRALRLLMDRRLSVAERPAAFAVLSTLLVGLAVGALLTLPHPRQASRTASASSAAPGAPTTAGSAASAARPRPAAHRPADRGELVADARAFTTGYLSYLYGGADAQTILRVSIKLRRALAHRPPRGRGRGRQVRLLDVQILTLTHARARVEATVADESGATFPIHLVLRPLGEGWEVTGLGT